jgi:hypothetical protein
MQRGSTWRVEIEFEEHGDHTRACANLEVGGDRLHARGEAQRGAGEANVPVVAEELAAARALSDLSHQLLDAAVERVEGWEGHA